MSDIGDRSIGYEAIGSEQYLFSRDISRDIRWYIFYTVTLGTALQQVKIIPIIGKFNIYGGVQFIL